MTHGYTLFATYTKEVSSFLNKWKEEADAVLLNYASELLPKELKVFKTK